ncbi:MAG: phytanoyl-CoA dioxygenase family protein [Gammaproteobacteria bacterium]|nr:phytanoyl-CoA dioxygenase family protein [Gammaproteobacteria bacterium]
MLSSEQIREFYEQGWTIVPSLFSADEMFVARRAFERLYDKAQQLRTTQNHDGAFFVLDAPAVGDVTVKRVVWAGGAEPDLLSLSADPRLVESALQLLGSDQCEQLLCQAHFKMPKDGVSFDWHQDVQHRDKGPGTWRDLNGRGSYVQTIMLVDDMTVYNGPLKFIPRSSVGGEGQIRLSSDPYDYSTPMRSAAAPAFFDESQAVTVTGTAGSVLFFGPYAIHGSTSNDSFVPRRVLINGYAYPGANGRVYPGEGSCRTLTRSAHG